MIGADWGGLRVIGGDWGGLGEIRGNWGNWSDWGDTHPLAENT